MASSSSTTTTTGRPLTRWVTACGAVLALVQLAAIVGDVAEHRSSSLARPKTWKTARLLPVPVAVVSPAQARLLALAEQDERRHMAARHGVASADDARGRRRPADESVEDALTVAEVEGFVQELHAAFGAVRPLGFGQRNGRRVATDADIWHLFSTTLTRLLEENPRFKKITRPPRSDGSIFVSISSFRDEVCPDTLESLFASAADPLKIFVGVVQQNCDPEQHAAFGCLTAVLPEDMKYHATGPDVDCLDAYCARPTADPLACGAQQRIRILRFNESETFGPVFGRYLGSLLWREETYYLQVDAHTTFARGWDAVLREDYANAPSGDRSLFSHYPPAGPQVPQVLRAESHGRRPPWELGPGPCMCDATFAEYGIVRIGSQQRYPFVTHHPPGCVPADRSDASPHQTCLRVARHAPYIGAGFVFAHSDLLAQVPFDPYLPFVFMGEELAFSTRAWTAGWDLFCPPRSVVAHAYLRPQRPKFWGALQRSFGAGTHNTLQRYVLDRVKALVGYPLQVNPTLLVDLGAYGLGTKRPLSAYLALTGLDFQDGRQRPAESPWCKRGSPPPLLLLNATVASFKAPPSPPGTSERTSLPRA